MRWTCYCQGIKNCRHLPSYVLHITPSYGLIRWNFPNGKQKKNRIRRHFKTSERSVKYETRLITAPQSKTMKCQIKNSSADQWQKKLFWAEWQLFVAKNDCAAAKRQWTFICQAASCWKMWGMKSRAFGKWRQRLSEEEEEEDGL